MCLIRLQSALPMFPLHSYDALASYISVLFSIIHHYPNSYIFFLLVVDNYYDCFLFSFFFRLLISITEPLLLYTKNTRLPPQFPNAFIFSSFQYNHFGLFLSSSSLSFSNFSAVAYLDVSFLSPAIPSLPKYVRT